MSKIVIVAESGSDIPHNIALEYGIEIVPMHIIIDGVSFDDGSDFPVNNIFEYHKKTGKVPSTSATNSEEYKSLFEEIHEQHPDKQILHLCYSAITTATWQNAHIGSEGMDFVHHFDTKNVSGGQAYILVKIAQYLKDYPDSTIEHLILEADKLINNVRFGFFSGDLNYLRAGGRVSNATYMGATLLNIKPLIELVDGQLTATKKYRGSMSRVSKKLVTDFSSKYNLEKESLYLLYTEGLDESIKNNAETIAKDLGFHNIQWVKAGGVITTHGGPGGFGIVGLEKE